MSLYNKTYVYILIAGVYNVIYIKTDIDTLFSNIDLSNYYTKSDVDDIDNELSSLTLNTYTNTEVDNLLYANYPSLSSISNNFYAKAEIDSTLSAYTNSTQLHTDFYSKVKTHIILDTHTTITQLHNGFYSTGYVNQMLVQSATLFELFTRKETSILY